MQGNFQWEMTENDWREYMRICKNPPERRHQARIFYGAAMLGAVRFEYCHTEDPDDWYEFASVYQQEENQKFEIIGLASPPGDIPLDCGSFDEFKQRCEEYILDYCKTK